MCWDCRKSHFLDHGCPHHKECNGFLCGSQSGKCYRDPDRAIFSSWRSRALLTPGQAKVLGAVQRACLPICCGVPFWMSVFSMASQSVFVRTKKTSCQMSSGTWRLDFPVLFRHRVCRLQDQGAASRVTTFLMCRLLFPVVPHVAQCFSPPASCEVGAQLSPDHRLSYRICQLLSRKYMWFLWGLH